MNEWREIMKAKGKLISSSKGMDLDIKPTPKKPKDTNCNQKLKEYAKFLADRDSIMFELKAGKNFKPTVSKKFGPTRESDEEDKYTERIIAQAATIPEEVACKALEYLEDDTNDDIQYRNFKDKSGENWTIGWLVQNEYEDFMIENFDVEDAAVLLVVYKKDATPADLPYPVYLSHRVILWEDNYQDHEEQILNEINWR